MRRHELFSMEKELSVHANTDSAALGRAIVTEDKPSSDQYTMASSSTTSPSPPTSRSILSRCVAAPIPNAYSDIPRALRLQHARFGAPTLPERADVAHDSVAP